MTGILSYVSELLEETFLPTVAYAEDEEDQTSEPEAEEEQDSESADGDEDEEEDDDDDEDEDEPTDVYPELREAAAEGKCHTFKHHFDECVERVTAAQEEEGYAEREYKENCVEEFFHLNHCLDDVTAPQLFRKLK